jgi:mannose-6-phosphate isomerase-like protein (cupin superfamily)
MRYNLLRAASEAPGSGEEPAMSGKSEATRAVDARTNQPIEPLAFDVDSHDDYLRLRAVFAALPKIPTLLRPEEQPTATAPNRSYNWLLTSEQSGGSIVLHVLTVEPGFWATEHHHPAEEEFFFVLDGELEVTIGDKTVIGGPGTFAYAPPNCTHSFRPHGGKPCKVLHWNSPGGHERLAVAQKRLARDGGALTPEAQRKVMEDHDYVFHDAERHERAAAAAEAAARHGERRGEQR